MALKAHSREVLFFDFIVKRRAQHAPFPPMRRLVELWERAAKENLPPKLFDKGDASCIINEVRIDEVTRTATLLLSVADKRAADATYGNHVKRSSRTVEKEADEGNEHSAHVVFSLDHRAGYPETYPCLVERVPSVSTPRIQSMLNEVIKRYCEADPSLFSYKAVSAAKEAGKAKEQTFLPNVILAGNPSAAFQREIEEGKLNGLRLIKTQPRKTLGSGNFLETSDAELKVSISKDLPKGQRWATIVNAVKSMSGQYDKARLYLAPAGGSSAASFDFDVASGTILGDTYVRRQEVSGLDPLLRSATDKILDHLAKRMVALLTKERDG